MNLGKLKALPVAPPSRKGLDIGREFARGQAYHRFGHLAEAQAAYRRVLKKARTTSMRCTCSASANI